MKIVVFSSSFNKKNLNVSYKYSQIKTDIQLSQHRVRLCVGVYHCVYYIIFQVTMRVTN